MLLELSHTTIFAGNNSTYIHQSRSIMQHGGVRDVFDSFKHLSNLAIHHVLTCCFCNIHTFYNNGRNSCSSFNDFACLLEASWFAFLLMPWLAEDLSLGLLVSLASSHVINPTGFSKVNIIHVSVSALYLLMSESSGRGVRHGWLISLFLLGLPPWWIMSDCILAEVNMLY